MDMGEVKGGAAVVLWERRSLCRVSPYKGIEREREREGWCSDRCRAAVHWGLERENLNEGKHFKH